MRRKVLPSTRRARTWTVLCAAAALLAAGCGTETGPATVSGTSASPYRGPLWVDVPVEDDLSHHDPAALGGAAARALECAGDPYRGGNNENEGWDGGGGSPEEALTRFLTDQGGELPSTGYRTDRKESDRALFSWAAPSGRTLAAVVVAKDRPERPGWGMETFAVCDPAEFPASHDEETGVQVWTDESGARVPVHEVRSWFGPEHCDLDGTLFVALGEGPEAQEYVRDTDGRAPAELYGTYEADSVLPADAKDTGYRRDGGALWLAADGRSVYLRTADAVERWPGSHERILCA